MRRGAARFRAFVWLIEECRFSAGNAIPAGPRCLGRVQALSLRAAPVSRTAFGEATIMDDWRQETRADYRRKGLGDRMGYGHRPVLLVVDFINGFTDPATPLGGDFSAEIAVTNRLLDAFRGDGLPVVYTTIAYEPDLRDAGMWVKKVPSLAILTRGSVMVEIDDRIQPAYGERVVGKKFASAFFGTELDDHLKGLGVDTVIMVGCTTSGCIRSSAIDTIQSGYFSIVVGDAVGDRAPGPHESNLFDIDAKYGDVVSSGDVLDYLRSLRAAGGLAATARADFRGWWDGRADGAG